MRTKKHASDTVAVRRDAKTGRMIPAGYGALEGKCVVRKGVDVTKPIFEQVRCRAGPEGRGEGSQQGPSGLAGDVLDTHAAIWLLNGEPMSADALAASLRPSSTARFSSRRSPAGKRSH
jgi:hypothetical protein